MVRSGLHAARSGGSWTSGVREPPADKAKVPRPRSDTPTSPTAKCGDGPSLFACPTSIIFPQTTARVLPPSRRGVPSQRPREHQNTLAGQINRICPLLLVPESDYMPTMYLQLPAEGCQAIVFFCKKQLVPKVPSGCEGLSSS